MKTIFLSALIPFFFTTTIFCQSEVIHLKNPSFEDYPRAERVPAGWIDLGFPSESAPDTHPSGAFNVIQTPADGKSYLGMVVRDNDTWEAVGQKLSKPLIGGQCYAFKINLCWSNKYVSISRKTSIRADYNEPIKLVVWGINTLYEKLEKLDKSPLIGHTDWQTYIFTFQPEKECHYIKLEAFYKEPILLPYNGNLLLDNASPIVPIPCDSIAIWNEKKYDELFNGIEPIHYERIEKPDIDINARIKEIQKQQAKYNIGTLPTIHYNSRLDFVEREKALDRMIEYYNEYPSLKVNIAIEEYTKSEYKSQKRKLLKDLKEVGIDVLECEIVLFKK